MGRAVVSVQRVDEGLHSQFIELWIAHRIEGGTTPEAAQRLALDGTLRNALQRNDICAFIAFVDSRPAGYVVLADSTGACSSTRRACRSTCSSCTPTSAVGRRAARCSRRRAATPTGRAASTSRARAGRGPRGQPLLRPARLRARDRASRDVVRGAAAQAGGGAARRRASLDLLQRRRDLRARARAPRHDPKIAG